MFLGIDFIEVSNMVDGISQIVLILLPNESYQISAEIKINHVSV